MTRTFGSYLLGDDQPCISQITDQVPAVGDQLGGLLLLRDSSFWKRQSQFKKEILRLVVRMVAEAGIHFLRCLGFHESQLRCPTKSVYGS
jgi:hypothetical protein